MEYLTLLYNCSIFLTYLLDLVQVFTHLLVFQILVFSYWTPEFWRFQKFNVSSIPYTIVIDKEGKIAYTHTGYSPGDEDELAEILEDLSGK